MTQYTQSQRAMFAAMIANATKGDGANHRGAKETSAHLVIARCAPCVTVAQAAKLTGSDPTAVQIAKRIRRTAAPEVTEAVKAGHHLHCQHVRSFRHRNGEAQQ
jgi:hypothetical protein